MFSSFMLNIENAHTLIYTQELWFNKNNEGEIS